MLSALTRPDAFTPGECARILALARRSAYAAAGLVGGEQAARIRRARIAWLDEADSAAWVFARVVDLVAEANRAHFGFDLTEFAERMQVAWYDGTAGGHFDWHSDIGDGPFAARRKLTLVVQLSDPADYEGGRLELNAGFGPVAAEIRQGSAILFPSFVLHRVVPVSRGARHSLTTWVHGPPFR